MKIPYIDEDPFFRLTRGEQKLTGELRFGAEALAEALDDPPVELSLESPVDRIFDLVRSV